MEVCHSFHRKGTSNKNLQLTQSCKPIYRYSEDIVYFWTLKFQNKPFLALCFTFLCHLTRGNKIGVEGRGSEAGSRSKVSFVVWTRSQGFVAGHGPESVVTCQGLSWLIFLLKTTTEKISSQKVSENVSIDWHSLTRTVTINTKMLLRHYKTILLLLVWQHSLPWDALQRLWLLLALSVAEKP